MAGVKLLVCLALVAAAAAAAGADKKALEPVLGKKFKLAESHNFEEVMKELGVGWITRKLGNAATPVIELTEHNGEYSLTSKSTFKNTDLRFRIGEPFEEETPDGRKVKSIITQEGNKLIHKQEGEKVTEIIREFDPKKITMWIKVGNVESKRVYTPADD